MPKLPLTIGLHYAKIFLKISWAVNTSCVTLDKIGTILLQKEILLENWLTLLLSMYCAALCYKISKKFSESESWNIRLDNFCQDQINCPCLEGNFWINWLTLLWSKNWIPSYDNISKILECISWDNCLWYKVA